MSPALSTICNYHKYKLVLRAYSGCFWQDHIFKLAINFYLQISTGAVHLKYLQKVSLVADMIHQCLISGDAAAQKLIKQQN